MREECWLLPSYVVPVFFWIFFFQCICFYKKVLVCSEKGFTYKEVNYMHCDDPPAGVSILNFIYLVAQIKHRTNEWKTFDKSHYNFVGHSKFWKAEWARIKNCCQYHIWNEDDQQYDFYFSDFLGLYFLHWDGLLFEDKWDTHGWSDHLHWEDDQCHIVGEFWNATNDADVQWHVLGIFQEMNLIHRGSNPIESD